MKINSINPFHSSMNFFEFLLQRKSTVICMALLLVAQFSPAQGHKAKLKSEKKRSLTQDNIVMLLPSSSSPEVVKVYSRKLRDKMIPSGLYKGMMTVETETGLIMDNGSKIPMPVGSEVIGMKKGLLYVKKSDWATNTAQIISYRIGKNQLTKLHSLNIAVEESSTLLQNGNVIVTDEYELYGTKIQLYSPSLTLLNTLQPFPDSGFSHAVFCDNGEVLVLAVESDRDHSTKLLYVNSKNGRVTVDKPLAEKIHISTMQATDEQVVATGYVMAGAAPLFLMLALDFAGNMTWQKDVLLPENRFIISKPAGHIYAFGKDGVIAIDLKTSATLWEQRYSALYKRPASASGTVPVMTRVIDAALISNDAYLAVIIGQTKNGSVGEDDTKYESVVYILDRAGALADRIENIPLSTKALRVLSHNGFFTILHDQAETQLEIQPQ